MTSDNVQLSPAQANFLAYLHAKGECGVFDGGCSMSTPLTPKEAQEYRVQLLRYIAANPAQPSGKIILATGMKNKRVYALLNKFNQMGVLRNTTANGWEMTTLGGRYLATGCESLKSKSCAETLAEDLGYQVVDNYNTANRWWVTNPPALAKALNWGATA